MPQVEETELGLQIKCQNTLENVLKKNSVKPKQGRWTHPECQQFEKLIEKYGADWKSIHKHIRGRSLSQIRSHAQKFFKKVNSSERKRYEDIAKRRQAQDILRNMPPEQAHEILRILHIQERKPNKEESKLALIKEEEVEDILAPNINKPTAECKVEEKSGSESEPKVVLMPQSTWQVHYHPQDILNCWLSSYGTNDVYNNFLYRSGYYQN